MKEGKYHKRITIDKISKNKKLNIIQNLMSSNTKSEMGKAKSTPKIRR